MRNYKDLQSEYTKKYVPLETQRSTQHGPKQGYKKGEAHFYNMTTSRADYKVGPCTTREAGRAISRSVACARRRIGRTAGI